MILRVLRAGAFLEIHSHQLVFDVSKNSTTVTFVIALFVYTCKSLETTIILI
jgi:hypothetical protein